MYDPTTGCHLWIGPRNNRGYGMTRIGQKHWLMHRFFWTLAHGPIPDGVDLCHRCDTPCCINTDHLFLGDQKANAADMMRKGRGRYIAHIGEDNGHAKLTAEQVVQIRAAYVPESVSFQQVADQFGCSKKQVINIVRRRQWGHLK